MKQIEKFLIVILILTIVSIAGNLFSNLIISRLYGVAEFNKMTLFNKFIASIPSFFRILVHICVAIWLFGTAREHKAQPWAWFVFGFFFGLTAAILFYLIRIYDMIRSRAEAGANSTV